MKVTRHYILGLVMICLSLYSWGQKKVTGTVLDESGEGIPGVTVLEKGTTNGAITDFNGIYSVTVANDESTLQFTSIGFATVEEVVGNRTTIDISLAESYSELDEVVVIGYGVQRKKVVTGAIESISSKDISSQPVARVDQALQGRAAGVQVVNQSGQPGEGPAIRIRGIGTDGDPSPLILVDGMAVNSIDNINPGDVESMEVLKDAASTSIYGARAANGVILITTKSGGAGQLSVTYSGYVGVQNVAKKVDLLNADQYVELMASAGANSLTGQEFDINEVPANNTDWQSALFTTNAPIEYHELNVQGGSEKSTFASSISYFNQEGIIGGDRSKIEKYIARVKGKTKLNEVFSIGSDITYTNLTTRGVASNASFNGEYNSALNLDPLTPVYETDEFLLGQSPYSSNPVITDSRGRVYGISQNVGQEVVNPLALLETKTLTVLKNQVLANIYGELKPIPNLTLRSAGSMDLSYLEFDSYNDIYYLSATNSTSSTGVGRTILKYLSTQIENTARYERKIQDHRFDFLVGNTFLRKPGEYSPSSSLSASGQGVDVLNPNLRYLNLVVDSTALVGGGASESVLISYFSRMLYDYKDRISFSASYRRDGSSKFGSENRFGGFWAFGASWVINEEPFFPDIPAISFLKLRTSWGQNGNDRVGEFAFASIVDFNIAYNTAGGPLTGAIPAFLPNQSIQWESQEQFDFGIDAGFFDNRLSATIDFYNKITKNLLQFEDGLDVAGLEATFNNVGEMQNRGIEISLGWRDSKGEFNYSVNVNGAYNKNTMTKIADESGFITGASWALAGEVTRTIEGQPVTSFYGFKTKGIFQTELDVLSYINNEGFQIQPNAVPGDIRFVDVNEDGIITDADRTVLGSPLPDWTFGTTLAASYKNFDFSTLLVGQYGNELFNGIGRPDILTSNKQSFILNRWTPENPSNTIPRFATNDMNLNYTRPTDLLNIEDGSYVRVKNIQFGYNLPSTILDKFNCQNWRVYVSAENLITFTNYSGPDPEVGGTSVRDTGIDRGIYPQARTFRMGTVITF